MKQNLIEQQFTRWTVISSAGTDKRGNLRWLCRCDCGVERVVYGSSLTRGATRSCGCLKRQLTVERLTTHGKSKTPEYQAWVDAEKRCINPNHKSFHNYGGRGIKFLLPDFPAFLAHIGPRPSSEHSLDRINNKTGHYEIGNIRWTLNQNDNKRNNINLAYNGRTQNVTAWARQLGIHKNTISERLKLGWSVEKTLSTPVKIQAGPLLLTYQGKTQHLAAWAREVGIPNTTIYCRLKRGWSVEEALGFSAATVRAS